MSQKLRQEQILHILSQRGYCTVRYLTEALHYSSATVNRDLNAMQMAGLVKRSYGGVEAVDRNRYLPLPLRQNYMKKEKRRNAHAAAELIQNGDTVYLDASTTVQYIAPFLADKKDLRVITNNMHLAIELAEYDMEIICLGGTITERPHMLGGSVTLENALRFHPDKMFFSVDPITHDGYVSTGGCYLSLYRVMLKQSQKAYLLTNQSKLTERIKESLCDFGALTGVISDFDFPEETRRAFPNTEFIYVKE
ncbi:MAG: DeoR/GlpR transcriptional regulator [Clostridia bacterium]|nr:DeoR/GlpR transcriptional regulator [Clostridia bacterium]